MNVLWTFMPPNGQATDGLPWTSERGAGGAAPLGRAGAHRSQQCPAMDGLFGAPGRSRTCDHQLRRLVLYPPELRAPGIDLACHPWRDNAAILRPRPRHPCLGARRGEDTLSVFACFRLAQCTPNTQFLNMVGVEGFEPTTPCSQSRCATRLRYTPSGTSRQAPLPRTAAANTCIIGMARSARGRNYTHRPRERQSGVHEL